MVKSFSVVNSAYRGVAQTHAPIRGQSWDQAEFIVQLNTAIKEQYLVKRD
jgi:hypothetical protein